VPRGHRGLTPFTGLDDGYNGQSASRVAGRIIRLLAERGARIYPAADQLSYKEKWGPSLLRPEYVAFQGGVTLRGVWSLLRLTRAL
jgi:lysylphosphatidylglycerol synthetase-like protein (DUF2156 family)